jgi:hypothetical protein
MLTKRKNRGQTTLLGKRDDQPPVLEGVGVVPDNERLDALLGHDWP